MRRWLWEQFNVSAHFRTEAPELVHRAWGAEPVPCARSLAATLKRMIREEECDPRDAIAWGRSACIEGQKVSRVEISAPLGLQPRDLHRRLEKVDEAIAAHVATFGFERPPPITTRESVISGLVQSADARMRDSVDEADGFYLAAADLAGLPTSVRIRPTGSDRTVRARVRHRARRTLPLSPNMPLGSPAQKLVAIRSTLESEPAGAIGQLEHAWRTGEFAALPLLLDHALSVVPDPSSAGPGLRRWLLEIGANIYRDAESLVALTWTSTWIREATADDTFARRIAANGRKTRAHVLQLHGFLDAARDELELADSAFSAVDNEIEDYQIIKADLQIRSAALATVAGNDAVARTLLDEINYDTSDQMRLSAHRYWLHVESMTIARTRRRGTFSRARAARYDHALKELHDALPRIPVNRQLTVIDTMIGAALRVGDAGSIRAAVDLVDWTQAGPQPNIGFRLAGHLKRASKLPTLADLGDIFVATEEHPLRRAGMVPRKLDFLI